METATLFTCTLWKPKKKKTDIITSECYLPNTKLLWNISAFFFNNFFDFCWNFIYVMVQWYSYPFALYNYFMKYNKHTNLIKLYFYGSANFLIKTNVIYWVYNSSNQTYVICRRITYHKNTISLHYVFTCLRITNSRKFGNTPFFP